MVRNTSEAAAGLAALALVAAACSASGELSTEQLSAVVEAGQPELERCYDEALGKHPLKEEVRLQAVIHVRVDGKVGAVELEPTPPLPGLAVCLQDAIGKWSFPTAESPTSTSLPLIFRPEVVQKPIE